MEDYALMDTEATLEHWNNHWRRLIDVGVTPTRLNIFRLFGKLNLPTEAKILDVGCGMGTLANYWKKHGYDITAIDHSQEAIRGTLKKGIKCTFADVRKGLPFPSNSFDLVYSDGLLEHFMVPRYILHELWRVSQHYVLTLVPRCTFYNTVHNLVFRPPKEYKQSDDEWVSIHASFRPTQIQVKKVRFGILWILCQKGGL